MVSLAALWRSVGVEPEAVVGHSQGEIAAAMLPVYSRCKMPPPLLRFAAARLQCCGARCDGRDPASEEAVRERMTPYGASSRLPGPQRSASTVISGDPQPRRRWRARSRPWPQTSSLKIRAIMPLTRADGWHAGRAPQAVRVNCVHAPRIPMYLHTDVESLAGSPS